MTVESEQPVAGRATEDVCRRIDLEHYHVERNHQGLDNELIDGHVSAVGEITSRERLGGLLRYYHRAA